MRQTVQWSQERIDKNWTRCSCFYLLNSSEKDVALLWNTLFLAQCSPSSKEGQTTVCLDTNDEIRSLKKQLRLYISPSPKFCGFFGRVCFVSFAWELLKALPMVQQFCYWMTTLRHWICFLSSVVLDGKDETPPILQIQTKLAYEK